MKLSDHVENIRKQIETAFKNRLGRMGITDIRIADVSSIPVEYQADRERIDTIREVWISETGSTHNAYEKLVEELTFTLFNRIAALKVMEAHEFHPEIITRRSQHGDRSFAHKLWLEENPSARQEELEGLLRFIENRLSELAPDISLFSPEHPYHLLPTGFELNDIITAFNKVDSDPQVEADIWKSDDVLGWLYESYNNYKKNDHKESGNKTEYNKVSIQSQVYTPRWVVKFLVDNSLGKLYLEMYPDSAIKNKYKIANAPITKTRDMKPLTEIRMIDPTSGSGNFLLYGFDLFYDMYMDQIENYGADYDERRIPELIITHNLYGIDLDDRAVQIAQLGLAIKARRKVRSSKITHFNVVSSDFYLPEFSEVEELFGYTGDTRTKSVVRELWNDLQQAYKFGSLIRLDEKLSIRLHGMVQEFEGVRLKLFTETNLAEYEEFRHDFFMSCERAVALHAEKKGHTFLNTKTRDAITFLNILSQKYDVAVANPPYTDSSDFGAELKLFVDTNYKKPHKFNSNLYATFIKRCFELTTEKGYIAMIHPFSFMFIKTFEDVRTLILDKTHIEILVDFGLDRVHLFDGGYASAPTFYILSKAINSNESAFFKLTDGLQERDKKDSFERAFDDLLSGRKNIRLFLLDQSKLKVIKTWPFIYWISDEFREKFKKLSFEDVFHISEGLKTSNNSKYLRYHFEIGAANIENYHGIFKGGTYNKWHGNIWLTINYKGQKNNISNESSPSFSGEANYFKQGIVCSSVGTKRQSFRLKPDKVIFSNADLGMFYKETPQNDYLYPLGILNSKFVQYINMMLNPTVNFTVGDISRIPFQDANLENKTLIVQLVAKNIEIKEMICSFKVIEINYAKSPLSEFSQLNLIDRLITYLNFENFQLTLLFLNEAILDNIINGIYNLSDDDKLQITAKMGKSVGDLPVVESARQAYLAEQLSGQEVVLAHIAGLPATEFESGRVATIKGELGSLYQSNNDLEEFCIRHQVNPINVWWWFRESRIVPSARAGEIAMEFLADAFRTILMLDEDGIIPLVGLPGEPRLMDRFEEYCFSKGFTTAQVSQFDGLLGRPIDDYIENFFFKNLSDHLNLFMYLPKTPFIWHLSSGKHQGFEAFIIIYKWNLDSLYKLKSTYLSKRTEGLYYRLQTIGDSTTAQAQEEKETIRLQLQEIEDFTKKIDDLIASGYNPKLDDGVGKNIAPLQKRGMLKAEVLKSAGKNSQLEKYLNADW